MRELCRPWAVWLALWLALLGALAPTLSHALVWARGDAALVEICSTTGPRWAAPEPADAAAIAGAAGSSSDASGAPASGRLLDHCPFCLLSADRPAPPPHVAVGHLALPGRVVPATSRQLVQAFSFFAFAPPPRGPPAFLNFSFHSA